MPDEAPVISTTLPRTARSRLRPCDVSAFRCCSQYRHRRSAYDSSGGTWMPEPASAASVFRQSNVVGFTT
jgi:hypothetical protein